jgi:hypothetical protein
VRLNGRHRDLLGAFGPEAFVVACVGVAAALDAPRVLTFILIGVAALGLAFEVLWLRPAGPVSGETCGGVTVQVRRLGPMKGVRVGLCLILMVCLGLRSPAAEPSHGPGGQAGLVVSPTAEVTPGPTPAPTPGGLAATVAVQGGEWIVHQIAPGDDLISLADRYRSELEGRAPGAECLSADDIERVNDVDPTRLQSGGPLLILATGCGAAGGSSDAKEAVLATVDEALDRVEALMTRRQVEAAREALGRLTQGQASDYLETIAAQKSAGKVQAYACFRIWRPPFAEVYISEDGASARVVAVAWFLYEAPTVGIATEQIHIFEFTLRRTDGRWFIVEVDPPAAYSREGVEREPTKDSHYCSGVLPGVGYRTTEQP